MEIIGRISTGPHRLLFFQEEVKHNLHFLFVNIIIILDNCRTHTENVLGVTQQLFHPEGEMERLRQSVTALALVSAMGNL